jgi:hypothetical protein
VMLVSSGTYARQIQTAATKLGVPLPEKFTSALTTAQQLSQAAASYDAVVSAMNSRALDLILEGRDPTADQEVQRLAVARVLASSGLRVAGSEHANRLVLDAITQCANEILTGWSQSLLPDYEVLHQAADQLGDVEDLHTADTAKCQRTGKLELLGAALAAHGRVSAAVDGARARSRLSRSSRCCIDASNSCSVSPRRVSRSQSPTCVPSGNIARPV